MAVSHIMMTLLSWVEAQSCVCFGAEVHHHPVRSVCVEFQDVVAAG